MKTLLLDGIRKTAFLGFTNHTDKWSKWIDEKEQLDYLNSAIRARAEKDMGSWDGDYGNIPAALGQEAYTSASGDLLRKYHAQNNLKKNKVKYYLMNPFGGMMDMSKVVV